MTRARQLFGVLTSEELAHNGLALSRNRARRHRTAVRSAQFRRSSSFVRWRGIAACAAFALLAQAALPATIAAVGNPDPNFTPGLLVNEQQALSVSWTASKAYDNVSVYVPLAQGGLYDGNAYAYLTTRVGLGTTSADQVASSIIHSAPGPDHEVEVFSGLNLGPGTYYLTLWAPSMSGGGGWAFATDPSIVSDSGVSVGTSQYAFTNPGLDKDFNGSTVDRYIPETIYGDLYSNEHLVFTVEAGVGVTPVPEPSWYALVALAVVFLLGKRRLSQARGSVSRV